MGVKSSVAVPLNVVRVMLRYAAPNDNRSLCWYRTPTVKVASLKADSKLSGGIPKLTSLLVCKVTEPSTGLWGVVGMIVPAPPSAGGSAAKKLLGISVSVCNCLNAVMLIASPTESLSLTLKAIFGERSSRNSDWSDMSNRLIPASLPQSAVMAKGAPNARPTVIRDDIG